MRMPRFFVLILLTALLACEQVRHSRPVSENMVQAESHFLDSLKPDRVGRGALLLTRFNSFEEFKEVVKIEYNCVPVGSREGMYRKSEVRLVHRSDSREVVSYLKSGVSEKDFNRARDENVWAKVSLVTRTPYALINRNDLVTVEILGRRRYEWFGEGDIAFYDLAEEMVRHISIEDRLQMSERDLSEKGFLNTFNHITAQGFMTSMYDASMADYIADVHERFAMPELITGIFTREQILDLDNGPMDNYVDMINNEWGQELGEVLKLKYEINQETYWTPELLADYLNDMQDYYSYAFGIRFLPFRASDDKVRRFSVKINRVKADVAELMTYYK